MGLPLAVNHVTMHDGQSGQKIFNTPGLGSINVSIERRYEKEFNRRIEFSDVVAVLEAAIQT